MEKKNDWKESQVKQRACMSSGHYMECLWIPTYKEYLGIIIIILFASELVVLLVCFSLLWLAKHDSVLKSSCELLEVLVQNNKNN